MQLNHPDYEQMWVFLTKFETVKQECNGICQITGIMKKFGGL